MGKNRSSVQNVCLLTIITGDYVLNLPIFRASAMAYVLNYLKCPASPTEIEGLVKFYAVDGKNAMGYQGLVKDVLKGMR